MKTIKTEKQVKTKSGEILPKGSPVTFQEDHPSICLVQGVRAEPYKIRVSSAFKAPDMEELSEEGCDGVCMSVAGYPTEPDGWCEAGSPSWLLALGLI